MRHSPIFSIENTFGVFKEVLLMTSYSMLLKVPGYECKSEFIPKADMNLSPSTRHCLLTHTAPQSGTKPTQISSFHPRVPTPQRAWSSTGSVCSSPKHVCRSRGAPPGRAGQQERSWAAVEQMLLWMKLKSTPSTALSTAALAAFVCRRSLWGLVCVFVCLFRGFFWGRAWGGLFDFCCYLGCILVVSLSL